ncbi:MAG: heavy-metal-associated domain-containing protein [Caldilineaceae bacterium]|nr:heavy-metal-associated domain-containing protein [Caldilineaceae bacterium]
MSQVTFNVPSISCGHCVRTIRAALGEIAGVQQVDVDIDTKQVAVVYDAAVVGEAQMKDVLAEADYPVADASAAQPEVLTLVEAGASCGCCRI